MEATYCVHHEGVLKWLITGIISFWHHLWWATGSYWYAECSRHASLVITTKCAFSSSKCDNTIRHFQHNLSYEIWTVQIPSPTAAPCHWSWHRCLSASSPLFWRPWKHLRCLDDQFYHSVSATVNHRRIVNICTVCKVPLPQAGGDFVMKERI